jgi:predicted cupin superfamily sugar epimerase
MSGAALSPATHTASDVIRLLGLAPLAREGGYFRRTMESEHRLPGSDRRVCSAIYFLLTPAEFSALHTVDADETWCFHAGDAVELLELSPAGGGRRTRLGLDWAAGEVPQRAVFAGHWQGARLADGGSWALVTCVVAPEYREAGFVLGQRTELLAQAPEFAEEICRLTRP